MNKKENHMKHEAGVWIMQGGVNGKGLGPQTQVPHGRHMCPGPRMGSCHTQTNQNIQQHMDIPLSSVPRIL